MWMTSAIAAQNELHIKSDNWRWNVVAGVEGIIEYEVRYAR